MNAPRKVESIGARLRRLRLQRGLSQRELSAPGVSYAYISRIEAGTRQPSVKALRKLAPKLGVSVEYLETGSEIGAEKQRELRLAEAELNLRLGDDAGAAEANLRDLVKEAEASADFASATRARIALGLLDAQRGRHDDAVRALEEALESETAPSPSSRPDVFATLGQSYAVLGRPETAVELFERCLQDLDESGGDNVIARIRFSIYLSSALADSGDLARAEEVVQSALSDAEGFNEPYTLVRLYWSVARLSSLQGRPQVALEYLRRAIALLEASEDSMQLGRAHILYAFIMNTQGSAAAAEEHLDTAERLLGSRRDTNDLASLRTEQAKSAAQLGKGSEAVERAEQALSLLGESDPAERGAALAALAQGHVLEGNLKKAEKECKDALELLDRNGRWRVAELACRNWSRVLAEAGRDEEAESFRKRADEYALRAGAPVEAVAKS
jgi:tetratricopeptide (TPR) repeat protein